MESNGLVKMYRREQPQIVEDYIYHDVLLSFDTTGSMSQFIEQLREDLQKFIPGIFDRYDDVQVGVSIDVILKSC